MAIIPWHWARVYLNSASAGWTSLGRISGFMEALGSRKAYLSDLSPFPIAEAVIVS
jgi:hypothetical protein